MPCDHTGPAELMEMAESHLRESAVDAERWPGLRFRFAENTPDGMWGSIVTEIERRGDAWIVVRLDRNREPLPEAETGFRAVS